MKKSEHNREKSRGRGRGRGRSRGRGNTNNQPGRLGKSEEEVGDRREARVSPDEGKGDQATLRSPVQEVGGNEEIEDQVCHSVLANIARELPEKKWKDLFRILMKPAKRHSDGNIERIIEELEHANPKDLNETKYKALTKWKECMGKDATIDILKKALEMNSLVNTSQLVDEFVNQEKEYLVKKELLKMNHFRPDGEKIICRQRYESGRTSPTMSLGFGSIASVGPDLSDVSLCNEPVLSEDILQALLQRVQSDVLTFKPNAKDYIKDNKVFMEDIVSMWNTPHRGDAHIIIGVNEHFEQNDVTSNNECVGIPEEDRRDSEFYCEHFNELYFNYKPDFVYTEVTITIRDRIKCVGVFIIKHNEDKAKTEPCVTQMCVANPDTSWVTGLVLARSIGKNTYADGSFLDTIYNWFGCLPSPRRRLSCGESIDSPKQECSSDEVTDFLKHTDHFVDTRAYVLITDCPADTLEDANVSDIGCVPWIQVFDFDPTSPISGLLKACEDITKRNGVLHKLTWRDPPIELTNGCTNWYFPLGYTIEQQHVLQDFLSWKKEARESVNENCKYLAEYCTAQVPLTILVLWYGKRSNTYLTRLVLSQLEPQLSDSYKLILCCEGRNTEEITQLNSIVSQVEDTILLSKISLGTVCNAIKLSQQTQPIKEQTTEFQLPGKSNETRALQSSDTNWLNVCLKVLYLNHNHKSKSGVDSSKLGLEFLRGNTLTWYELKVGRYDATRDLSTEVMSAVVDYMRKSKSGIIELFHDPGAGGTTLGRRVLWEIHLSNKAPCANVTSTHDIKALSKRIEFLYQCTLLPIVLLLDGSDAIFCRQLLKILENCVVIILLVQRTVSKIQRGKGRFHLTGKVSENEAAQIQLAFSRYIFEKQKLLALTKLATSVRDKKMHHVYEFGLAAYEEEFKGVQSYVKGYLEYDTTEKPCGWQRVLSFLALAYYYGHLSVPAQLFADILGVNKKSAVMLKHMKRTEFIIESCDNGIRKWRIIHYVVAREILEQLYGTDDRDSCRNGFSSQTKEHIGKLACEFIEEASKAIQGKQNKSSPAIMEIVLSTVIYRDYDDHIGTGDVKQKRPKLSRLISDIKSNSPYEERLEVLRKFTECFPQNPSGWAHLGRFYGLYRANEIPKAKEYFNTAIGLRRNEIKRRIGTKHSDKQLSHIYHMYGTVYGYELKNIIGNVGKIKHVEKELSNPNSEFLTSLESCAESTQLAIDNFIMCRKYVKQGYEQTYDYSSELSVRLNLIEFITNHCSIEEYLECEAASQSSKELVRECFPKCDMLILEWNELDKDGEELHSNINKFHVVFHGAHEALIKWQGEESVLSRRSKISAYKLIYNQRQSSSIDMVTSVDVSKIVKLYEDNINQVHHEGIKDFNLDCDVIQWLRALRSSSCTLTYTIEEVICFVRKWCEVKRSPYAVYYLFVLNVLLGIGANQQSGLSINLIEAQKLCQEVKDKSKLVSKPGTPLEWVGKNKGIRRLINNRTLRSKAHKGDHYWKSLKVKQLLEVRYGYIVDSSKRVNGRINLISKCVGPHTNDMNVSFSPIHDELYDQRFKGEKVAFNLAFSMSCGLKAHNVCLVKTVQCKECKRSHEYSALDHNPNNKYIHCQCSRGKPIPVSGREEFDSL